jgi:hypothetical protein
MFSTQYPQSGRLIKTLFYKAFLDCVSIIPIKPLFINVFHPRINIHADIVIMESRVVVIIMAAVISASDLYCLTIIYVESALGKVKVITATLKSIPVFNGIRNLKSRKAIKGCTASFSTVAVNIGALSFVMADIFSPLPTAIRIRGDPIDDSMSTVFDRNFGSGILKYVNVSPAIELMTSGSEII